jgi:hypothetical protein
MKTNKKWNDSHSDGNLTKAYIFILNAKLSSKLILHFRQKNKKLEEGEKSQLQATNKLPQSGVAYEHQKLTSYNWCS